MSTSANNNSRSTTSEYCLKSGEDCETEKKDDDRKSKRNWQDSLRRSSRSRDIGLTDRKSQQQSQNTPLISKSGRNSRPVTQMAEAREKAFESGEKPKRAYNAMSKEALKQEFLNL